MRICAIGIRLTGRAARLLVVLAVLVTPTAPAAAAVYYSPYPSAPRSARVPPHRHAALPPNIIYQLPPGCTQVRVGNVVLNECAGGVWYSPCWYGPNVVYAPAPPPY